jgi:arginyl-tRNA synthetase
MRRSRSASNGMKEKIIEIIRKALEADSPVELSVPEEPVFGHYSTNVAMRLAGKASRQSPMELARELAKKIVHKAPFEFFEKVEAAEPGFINFWLSKKTIWEEFQKAAATKEYGRSDRGKKKTVIVEYSSVNIAKPFHLGHFRTTIIGDALANLLAFSGYNVVRWNYLGDWGTQFGKLIAAYKRWGKKENIEKNPVEELQKLYVRFHSEAESDAELEKRGQEEFKKLEEGDAENRKLWEWFKKESLEEFETAYRILDVNFDIWIGESHFEKELKPLTKELLDRKIAERSEGAIVIKLDAQGLPPALIEKSDGASLYHTRDIANLRYRLEKYKPAKILYVVGNEQSLYFEQLFAIAKILKLDSAELKHVKYGLVLGEAGKKLSTRRGETVAVKELLGKATALARKVAEEKARDLTDPEKNDVALAVGIGALKYNDLKENRMTDIVFDWDRMLDFTGDSAPYLQYTYARLQSILRKSDSRFTIHDSRFDILDLDVELSLMRKIFEFPDVVSRAGETYATSVLAAYLYKLAVAANKYYETTPILKDHRGDRKAARLVLIETAARVLQTGLKLLGIKTLEKI